MLECSVEVCSWFIKFDHSGVSNNQLTLDLLHIQCLFEAQTKDIDLQFNI